MSLQTTNSELRNKLVKNSLSQKKKIYNDSVNEKLGEIENTRVQMKFLEPILEEQKRGTEAIMQYAQQPAIEYEGAPLAIEDTTYDKYGVVFTEAFARHHNALDTKFGIRMGSRGKLFIGNTPIKITENSDIIINKDVFPGSDGLFNLIMDPNPKEGSYTAADLEKYKSIIIKTAALHRKYDSESPYTRGNVSEKWNKILAPIWKEEKNRSKPKPKKRSPSQKQTQTQTDILRQVLPSTPEQEGEGVVYLSSDPMELCDRLGLLLSAFDAGNTGVRNEIVSITDSLLKKNCITKKQYKKLNNLINKE